MDKNEMKIRISFALRDPVLQQGFEIICKNLAELEKENAELKNQLEMGNKVYNDNLDYSHHIEESLTKAKDIIRMLIDSYKHKERFSFEKDLMKADEEMAEEYENAQDYCGLLDVLFEEQYNQDYGGLSCYISPYIDQAFLAGLKAGRDKGEELK